MQKTPFLRLQAFLTLLIIVGFVISSFSLAHASRAQLADPPVDQVVVKLKPGVAINTILTRYNASLLGTITETRLYFLKLLGGQTANQVLPALNADTDLFYAEPNYYADGAPGGGVIMFGARMAPLAEVIMFGARGDLTATPPGGPDQWAWIKVGLADAQKISHGQAVIVAVLDTGLAADHPLLNSSITAGYDFVGMTNDIYDTGNGLDDDGDGRVDEDLGHGTHVSGIIVTEASGVQIMPIRVLNSDGVGTYWEVAAGIRYAVDHGAKIINMSLSAPRLTPSLADALGYAASHGVLVVAAAGTGPGPNYPAAYSDPLAVLGVGASNQNDGVAGFSGGQAVDLDVFAPGVDIYSAFPYNGYALGSGTSMAAPMVAGEAALLKSRYPNWTPLQVVQRIIAKTNPVSGATAGRINLSAALNTGLEVDYSVGDPGSPNDNNIKPNLRLVNHTPENIPLNELKIRYWYTIDSDQSQMFNCYYTVVGCGNLVSSFLRLPANHPNKTAVSDTYLELGFAPAAGNLAGGAQFDMQLRVNKVDWSMYGESNDYSYDATKTSPTRWERVTMYRNGVLVWGVEPGVAGSPTPSLGTATRTSTPVSLTNTPTRTKTTTPVPGTATRTNTPAAPSATATRTKTSTPAAASTATRTNPPAATLTPSAAAATATRTRTATSLPNTPTRTNTLAAPTPTASGTSSLRVQYMTGATLATSQVIAPQLILFNQGSTSLPLDQVKIRYWFTVDGDKPQSYWCDYFFPGCANVTVQFVPLLPARPAADYYLELGFTAAAGSLAPGANTGPLQSRFSKNDWSFYTQTGDYSFDPSKTQFADWTKITAYRNGILAWGVEP